MKLRIEKFRDFKEYFEGQGILKSEAEFKCYSDHIFTYGVDKNNIYYEINIIADMATFFRNDKVAELLKNKEIEFFEVTAYAKDEKGKSVSVYYDMYNVRDSFTLN